ncbi:MAG: amidophosphoribosyltransferase [Candidatus Diapherotrites archaeon]|nr:amidophosphoribosyltransferase [Candidatus Diapherotrites archaeon]
MCGIVGILSNENTSKKIYQSLLSLQHRGQDSVGIATLFDGKIRIRKKKGLVTQTFKDHNLSKLQGNIGIGHVRYTTAGACTRKNAQPFFTSLPIEIAMASNGNTINYEELKKWLWDKNISLSSQCDLEGLMQVFSLLLKHEMHVNNREKPTKQDVIAATRKFMEKAIGSYSIVGIIKGIGLIAFRDPKGIKPLVIGEKKEPTGKSYLIASETVACDALDFELVDDVQPGEIVIIDRETGICRKKLVEDTYSHCMFEYVYFARPDSDLNGKSVYKTRQRLGEEIVHEWAKKQDKKNIEVDVVIAAPDTSRTAALAFSEKIKVPYREGLIKNRYIGRTFIMPTQSEREDAANLKINTLKHEVTGKKIAIIDDSIVRGTTSAKLIAKLKKSDAKSVHMISTCPKIMYPCIYGIDMPTKDELIANNKTEAEIAQEIGADTVTYQTIEGLKKAIGCENLCTACLDGNYPIKMKQTTLEEIAKKRTEEINSNNSPHTAITEGLEGKTTATEGETAADHATQAQNAGKHPKILVIGNSAREHIIAETLKKSVSKPKIYAFMNAMNPGIAGLSEQIKIGALDDVSAIVEFAKQTKPEFAFIGPELPISAGVADELEKMGIPSVGPKKELGKLETSKSFTRLLLKKHNIFGNPKFEIFSSTQGLEEFLESLQDTGFVVKPDGLTGGKGVKVQGEHLQTVQDGIDYCKEIFAQGNKAVIEEKLAGEEFSLQSFVDGETVIDMPPIQDHKRAFEDDTGPNTGGMGSYNGACKGLPFITKSHIRQAHDITIEVNKAILAETKQKYKGIMYGGFIATKNGVKLIEYNARLGDPEAINALTLLETDLVEICRAITATKLKDIDVKFSDKATVCKYLVPKGYPDNPSSGDEVDIRSIEDEAQEGVNIYFASVNQQQGKLFMSSSRALGIVAVADTIDEAQEKAEKACMKVKGNVRYRSDIGTPKLLQKRIEHMKEIGACNLTRKSKVPQLSWCGPKPTTHL